MEEEEAVAAVTAVELSNRFGAKDQSQEGANSKVLAFVVAKPMHCGGWEG